MDVSDLRQRILRALDAAKTEPAKRPADGANRRAELDAAPADARVIQLPPELNSDPRTRRQFVRVDLPVDPWYLPLLRWIADDARLRRKLLLAAAGVSAGSLTDFFSS